MNRSDVLAFLPEFKFGQNTSQTAAKINRAWCEWSDSTMLVSEVPWKDMNLEDQEGGGHPNWWPNPWTLLEQNPCQSIWELSQAMGVSISTISDPVKIIGKVKKLDKWVLYELSKRERV